MAEHVLETKIQLRYDTYSNWMRSTLILKPGEAAVAVMAFNTTITNSDSTPINTPPAIGLKIGDGHSYFSELPWVQAVAGDVYNWAKQSTKPTYTAGEIEGLQAFVEEHSSGGGSSGGDPTPVVQTSRIYQLVRGTDENINKYYLRYKTADSNDWIIDTSTYIDLSLYEKVVNWIGEDLDYFSLDSYTFMKIYEEFAKKNYPDVDEEGKVVVAVPQNNGSISTIKRALNLNELTGILSVNAGGTGIGTINEDEILVGTATGIFTKRLIQTELESNNNLSTNAAIKTYIDTKTAGLAGAMHYIGESSVEINPLVNPTVNPNIGGYDFNKVQLGDVITYNSKEYIWTNGWRLLGGSYAVKGNIVDADISPEANIQQNKILNLTETLASKVDVIEGKSLSTNDYTTAEKNKLSGIEEGAQVNAIEHIFVNDRERPITVIDGKSKSIALSIDVFDEEHAAKLDGIQAGAQVNVIEHIFVNGVQSLPFTYNNYPKSVNLILNEFTNAEKQKLADIEEGAQVNQIESIYLNNTLFTANDSKEVHITLDPTTLELNAISGAEIPKENRTGKDDVPQIQKKLQFERIAVSGDVKDLQQTANTYVILDCGTSDSDTHPNPILN